MKLPRRTLVAAVAVFAAFVVFDLCGRTRAKPLPSADLVASAAGGVPVLDFDVLAAGDRAWPDAGAPAPVVPVPPEVLARAGTRIAVAGYMLPMDVEGGRAKRFLLCRYPGGCCFGGTIEPDDLIECEVADGGRAEIVTHVPVLAVGTFRVREAAEDSVNGLWALDACEVRTLPAAE